MLPQNSVASVSKFLIQFFVWKYQLLQLFILNSVHELVAEKEKTIPESLVPESQIDKPEVTNIGKSLYFKGII